MREHCLSILLVEDDDALRDMIKEALISNGFAVTAASTGQAALCKAKQRPFDLIAADIKLPGELDGLRLVRKVREYQPALRCLFFSGYYKPIVCDPVMDEFISKPFRLGELIGCVWKVLTGNQPNPRITIADPE